MSPGEQVGRLEKEGSRWRLCAVGWGTSGGLLLRLRLQMAEAALILGVGDPKLWCCKSRV